VVFLPGRPLSLPNLVLWLLMQSKAAAATSLMEWRWVDGHGGVDDTAITSGPGGGGAMVAAAYSREGA
jgi:hypothetical protein